MKELPNMVLIGSTARNSGKTKLATMIINKLKTKHAVIALKITTIAEKNGKCIRGKEGCGACSSLRGNYEIIEELTASNNKDTSRLLAAGAVKVYWLKTLKDCINEGIDAFMSLVPENTIIVCESNSLRKFVNPGVFVMAKNMNETQIKKSAMEVMSQADLIFENDLKADLDDVVREIEKRMKLK